MGIPLPSPNEPKMAAKKNFNSKLSAEQRASPGPPGPRVLEGEAFYQQQGWRALNQALGRAVRHPRDYGAMVLLDERHSHPEHHQHLPKWLRNLGLRTEAAPVPTETHDAARALAAFFAAAQYRFC